MNLLNGIDITFQNFGYEYYLPNILPYFKYVKSALLQIIIVMIKLASSGYFK